ncbi:hypothetical protein HG530_009762 [Fusarium avenaceum]|nr:hypothetical protein HG530_009762 [Fusarium avenaceum]
MLALASLLGLFKLDLQSLQLSFQRLLSGIPCRFEISLEFGDFSSFGGMGTLTRFPCTIKLRHELSDFSGVRLLACILDGRQLALVSSYQLLLLLTMLLLERFQHTSMSSLQRLKFISMGSSTLILDDLQLLSMVFLEIVELSNMSIMIA